jgi:hypothetical protein
MHGTALLVRGRLVSTTAPNDQPPCGFEQSVGACGGAPATWASRPPSFVLVTVQVEPDTTTVKASPGVVEVPQKHTMVPSVAVTTQHVLRGGLDAAPVQPSVPKTGARPNRKAMLVFIGDHHAIFALCVHGLCAMPSQ